MLIEIGFEIFEILFRIHDLIRFRTDLDPIFNAQEYLLIYEEKKIHYILEFMDKHKNKQILIELVQLIYQALKKKKSKLLNKCIWNAEL